MYFFLLFLFPGLQLWLEKGLLHIFADNWGILISKAEVSNSLKHKITSFNWIGIKTVKQLLYLLMVLKQSTWLLGCGQVFYINHKVVCAAFAVLQQKEKRKAG